MANLFDMFNAEASLKAALNWLPIEKKQELAQYHTLTRSEQIEFRKNLILKYGYKPNGKAFYNLATGGMAALGLFSYYLLKGQSDPFSPEFQEFQKKLAGAFLGGHLGQFAVTLFNEFAEDHAIRNESQETFIIGTLVFAGGEGIDWLENTLKSQTVFVPEVNKSFETFNIAPAVYTAYNAFNFLSIAFQLYWQNALSAEFDKLYPLKPESGYFTIPNVNQSPTPIAGYRVF